MRIPLNARILLAGDFRSGVQECLAGSGCELTVANDGAAAFEALTHGSFNLVVVDVDGLDGYEVARRFREWERSTGRPRTPVVTLSADVSPEEIDRAVRTGTDGHLANPAGPEILLEAIAVYQRADGAASISVQPPDFVRELAPEFLQRQRQGLFAVVMALKKLDFEPIQVFAHNMKGCGRSFGFDRLTEMGRELEHAAKERDVATLRRHLDELREYLVTVDIA